MFTERRSALHKIHWLFSCLLSLRGKLHHGIPTRLIRQVRSAPLYERSVATLNESDETRVLTGMASFSSACILSGRRE